MKRILIDCAAAAGLARRVPFLVVGGPTAALRFCAAAATADAAAASSSNKGDQKHSSAGTSLSPEAPGKPKRNMIIFSNTTKAVYVHPWNKIASVWWMHTDFHKWFTLSIVVFVGSQFLARLYVAKMATTTQAQLGETLLDQRTRELLSDIEKLRLRDPMRLENEANAFHDLFWQRRAKHAASQRTEQRTMEMQRGLLQGEARGTDMTEWMGAKVKDDEEREVARRTHDYIQGFHQHLKAKRLI